MKFQIFYLHFTFYVFFTEISTVVSTFVGQGQNIGFNDNSFTGGKPLRDPINVGDGDTCGSSLREIVREEIVREN